jgi:hypothetical protein
MSLESTIIAISLLLGIVLLILIIYLISRVNDLEARAFSNAMPSDTANSVEPARQKVFAGLSGRELWDEWVAMANGAEDQYQIKGDQERFLALLELHVRSVIKTGMEHGQAGITEPPSNPLKIKMLRGEFESSLPSSQAERLYALSKELGVKDNSDRHAALVTQLEEVIDAISMAIDAGSSFVESAIRDVAGRQSSESPDLPAITP